MKNVKKTHTAAVFDDFSYVCPFFTTRTGVNNGYGCNHPAQEEQQVGDDGEWHGACYCWSCPIGIQAEDEDIDSPTVDWDDNEVDSGDVEGEYILVKTDETATDEEKQALNAYKRYINRYNQ